MPKSIKEISDIISNFSDIRGWKNEDPTELINSIYIEMGELTEHFQWKHKFSKLGKTEKTELGYEFVDVIFFLFRLASRSDINMEEYFDEKLPKLEKKFPIGSNAERQHKEYRRTGKNKRYE